MRQLWAGLIGLFLSSAALAQATGYVRELGFGGNYRPDCWTPLLVHLDSTLSEPGEFQLQVNQQDLDHDTVVYTRTVTLGPQAHENFWVNFKPQPTDGGLPGAGAAAQLGDVLKVSLYDKTGKTLIASLPIQTKADNFDPGGADRAGKLVLVVVEQSYYHAQEYVKAQGVIEDVHFVPIRVENLPDQVTSYQAVDAILWLDAKFSTVRNTPVFTAIQSWVRMGGNFAVVQPSDRTQLEALVSADMLPVIAKTGPSADAAWAIQIRPAPNLDPLKALVVDGALPGFSAAAWAAVEAAHPSFEIAYAQPRPDAMVDAWITWPSEKPASRPDEDGTPADTTASSPPAAPPQKTPFIARRAYGLGSVAWVAQDLGSPILDAAPDPTDKPQAGRPIRTLLTNGWPRIWDRVFGWRNQTRTFSEIDNASRKYPTESDFQQQLGHQYATGGAVDLGMSLLNRTTEHGARSTAYVFVAILFFVGYWIVAGPGSYLFLAARKRRSLSWTVFGASALLAAVVTLILVRLLLRGGPEAKQLTLVRLAPGPAAADGSAQFQTAMHSWMGVYIPNDGEQLFTVAAPGVDGFSSLAPYAVNPRWLKADEGSGFTDTAKYFVNLDPVIAGKSVSVGFPYRSTAKKVEAQWNGMTPGGISGAANNVPIVDANSPLTGVLTNNTGHDLIGVYFVFTDGWIDTNGGNRRQSRDRVLYVPEWKANTQLDLSQKHAKSKPIATDVPGSTSDPIYGTIGASQSDGFSAFWYSNLQPSLISMEDTFDDEKASFVRSFPIISLIDRIGPLRSGSADGPRRPEPVRRGVREFDMSPQVAAGKLVILAHTAGSPTPLPTEVNESPLAGDGYVFYQVALPVNRDALRPQPTTRPAA